MIINGYQHHKKRTTGVIYWFLVEEYNSTVKQSSQKNQIKSDPSFGSNFPYRSNTWKRRYILKLCCSKVSNKIMNKNYCLPISKPRPPIPLKKTWDLAIFCIAVSPRTYLCRLYVKYKGKQ